MSSRCKAAYVCMSSHAASSPMSLDMHRNERLVLSIKGIQGSLLSARFCEVLESLRLLRAAEPEGISAARMQKRKAEDESLDDAEGEQPAKRRKRADQNGHVPPSSSTGSQQAISPSSAPQDSKQQAADIQNNSEGGSPEEPDKPHKPCSPASHLAEVDVLGWIQCSQSPHTIAPLPPDSHGSHCSASSTCAQAPESCHTDQSLVSLSQESSAAAITCLNQTASICPGASVQQSPATDLLSAAGNDPERTGSLSGSVQATQALTTQAHSAVPTQLAISVAT